MDSLSIFQLLAGGASALAAAYGVGRMFYVAVTAPTSVERKPLLGPEEMRRQILADKNPRASYWLVKEPSSSSIATSAIIATIAAAGITKQAKPNE